MQKTIHFFFILLLIPAICLAQPYENLVLKGGGIRGIAYAGSLKVLEEKHITNDIENVAGTSVGAIVGTLYSVGYTADEIYQIMLRLKVHSFNDGKWFFIGGQHRLRKDFGWYRGMVLQRWLNRLIKDKTGYGSLTFLQLHELHLKDNRYKDLYITATNVSLQRMELLSYKTFPQMQIVNAVRASTAVPLYYAAVLMDSTGNIVRKPKKNQHYNIYIDGGLLANYPLGVFDKDSINKKTLGLKLERPEQIDYYNQAQPGIAPYEQISSFNKYIGALYNLTIESLNDKMPHRDEQFRTIYISTSNLSPRVRKITKAQKLLLYKNGKDAAAQFFKS